uniref:uncharacterized protein LOC122584998 n=1 Tax=Erigeron canadensis TaxID=72917 RepID=UPI001CB926CC|nr:uncharacterized protein LOC122584998 [Erigeron canadensis]XP_043613026.1 uncharacterized protein LOC122584998 [Erigeron canadensis]XP_043613027.1 uncharacterized protein LOC122584998 [Erigeron canadensis]
MDYRTSKPAFEFSNEPRSLQEIDAARMSPVSAQIKQVIDLLSESRKSFTAEQIREKCCVDVFYNDAIFQRLVNSPKVNFDGKLFSYKHNVRDQKALLKLIQSFPEGIAVAKIRNVYPTIIQDLQILKARGQIMILSDIESQEVTAYPNNPKAPIKVDDELKSLYREADLPREIQDIEFDLQNSRMNLLTNSTKSEWWSKLLKKVNR